MYSEIFATCFLFAIFWKSIYAPTFTKRMIILEGKYINASSINNSVCDLPKEKKFAICDTILRDDLYIENFKVYFSKSAAAKLEPRCQKKPIKFLVHTKQNRKLKQQDMFPCYGRHNPMRTNWRRDDHFDSIYISGGPDENSIFVYVHDYGLESDIFNLFEIVEGLDLKNLQPLIIEQREVQQELKTLQTVSYNYDVNQIERSYVRHFLLKDSITVDQICKLSNEAKIKLCESIFERNEYEEIDFVLDKSALKKQSLECEFKHVIFVYKTKYNKSTNDRKMFPCYGQPKNIRNKAVPKYYSKLFYVSQGHRLNSAIVYTLHTNFISYQIFEFIENFNIEKLKFDTEADNERVNNEKIEAKSTIAAFDKLDGKQNDEGSATITANEFEDLKEFKFSAGSSIISKNELENMKNGEKRARKRRRTGAI